MKPKTLILMIVAVVCGLGASYMTSRLLAERSDAPADAPAVEKVKLLVARNAVPMHQPIGKKPETTFVEKDFVKDDAPKDGLPPADIAKLKDKFLKRGLRKGDHVTLEDLMDGTSALTTLPDGMRAVGIQVSSQQTASGFACVPGSHVDIHWTTRTGNENETLSKVLLEDVVILAADVRTVNENGGAMPSNVVTVALHPDDSLKLTNAMETGSLRLVLRNLLDRSSGQMNRVSKSDLIKDHNATQKPVDPTVAAVNPTPPEVKTEPRVDPKDPQPEPEPIKATRKMVTIRNGAEVQLHYFWVDEQDRIVPPPGMSDRNYDAVPAPSVSSKGKSGGPSPDGTGGGN